MIVSQAMSSRPYSVYIYEDEAKLISKWTLRYFDVETGGDFFGLWLNENEVIIQAVLGPGQKCHRTATSFFQDEEYLSNIGGLLTHNEGLCNIGSWHSHHTMRLSEPSQGDKDTVWRHLPSPGRFLLLISTIVVTSDGPKVQMSFSLFESTEKGKKLSNMNSVILKGRSPIRANEAINSEMCREAEKIDNKKTSSMEPRDDRHGEKSPRGRKDKEGGTPRKRKGSHHYQRLAFSKDDQHPSCDGRHSYYVYRNGSTRYPRPPEVEFWLKQTGRVFSNGAEEIEIFHRNHKLHGCRFCRGIRLRKTSGGNRLFVERAETCNIL